MFRDPEEKAIVEQKIYSLIQKGSAIEYTTQFQMYITRTNWNKKALIALYKKGLKTKVQNIIILIEDIDTIKELIDQVVKINN